MGEAARVGLGIIIQNKDGKILVGKRKGSHAQKWSIPGGKLEVGEDFEEAIIREAREETNLDIRNPKLICVTNNLETYREDKVHFISVEFYTNEFSGELRLMEPQKCEEWRWVDPKDLPMPHFDASRFGIRCFLEKKIYIRPE